VEKFKKNVKNVKKTWPE